MQIGLETGSRPFFRARFPTRSTVADRLRSRTVPASLR